VKSAALSERRKEYVEAAENLGYSKLRVMFRHVMPNSLNAVLVVATVQIASAITLEATLSFLGVGVPVTEPSLGLLVASGFNYLMSGDYWISFYPGIALLFLGREKEARERLAAALASRPDIAAIMSRLAESMEAGPDLRGRSRARILREVAASARPR